MRVIHLTFHTRYAPHRIQLVIFVTSSIPTSENYSAMNASLLE